LAQRKWAILSYSEWENTIWCLGVTSHLPVMAINVTLSRRSAPLLPTCVVYVQLQAGLSIEDDAADTFVWWKHYGLVRGRRGEALLLKDGEQTQPWPMSIRILPSKEALAITQFRLKDRTKPNAPKSKL
jgi:hypothetical protein